jgi:hypothetical protein
MKIRQTLEGWPLSGWTCEELSPSSTVALEPDRGTLRLTGFTGPDSKGWFTLVARDRDGREWSTSIQVEQVPIRSELERLLAENIRASLADIGEMEVAEPGLIHASHD